MSFLRADGKPFVTDRRGAVPQVVIEDGEDGEAVVVHQFTLDKVRIGPRPYDHGDARRACMELIQKARKTARRGVTQAAGAASVSGARLSVEV